MECTPEQREKCELRRHFTNQHHIYYPRREYTSPVESAFRRLSENIVEMCRWEHIQLHDEQDPPPKPDLQTMAEAIVYAEVHMTRKVQEHVTEVLNKAAEEYWHGRG